MTITGPFVTNRNIANTEIYVQHKYRYSGKRPRPPLPYFVAKVQVGGNIPWALSRADSINSEAAVRGNTLMSSSALYDKFYARVGGKAETLMNLYESKSTWNMVQSKVVMLYQAARHIRRGEAAKAVKALGLTSHPKSASFVKRWKGNTKQSSKAWLEFTFGWAPVAADMQSVVKIFEREFNTRVRARLSAAYTVSDDQTSWDPILDRKVGTYVYASCNCIGYASAEWRVSNTNLYLANQLGLVNLGSVLWDAIPFSFVLDWFGKFGTYIRSLTDQLGVEFRHAYRGWSTIGSGSGADYNQTSRRTASWKTLGGGRSLGLPTRPDPFDRLRIPQFDPWLAVTSFSLLLTTIKSLR